MTLIDDTLPATPPRHRRRLHSVLRRRWWVALLCVALGAGMAFAVASRTPAKYAAESVLVVPAVVPGQPPPGSPDAAIKLAKTYSTLIALDDEILAASAVKANVDPTDLRRGLTVTNDTGTALIRVDVQAPTPRAAVDSAVAITLVITRASPPGQIINGSIKVVQIPTSATTVSETTSSSLAIGGLLGLILGLVLIGALERSDRRIDSAEDLAATTGSGATVWTGLSVAEARALNLRWRRITESTNPSAVLVGTGDLSQVRIEAVASDFRERVSGGRGSWGAADPDASPPEQHDPAQPVRLMAVGRPGRGEGAELAAQTADLIVLVVTKGAKASKVTRAVEQLAVFGIIPTWALLVGKSPSSERKESAHAEKPVPFKKAETMGKGDKLGGAETVGEAEKLESRK